MAELQRGLRDNRIDVAMIDPLYLALSGGSDLQASSMYEMGPLFLKVTQACLGVGCTPILIHHFRQTRQSNVDEGQLEEDFTGRRWEVTVSTQTEAIQARKEEAQAAKREKEQAKETEQENRVLMALDSQIGPDGAGLSKVRVAAGLNSDTMEQVVFRLKARGIIEEVLVTVATGTSKDQSVSPRATSRRKS